MSRWRGGNSKGFFVVVQVRGDGGLGSRRTSKDSKTLSNSGSVSELGAACFASRLDVSGKERAIKEEYQVSVLSSWVNRCSIY